MRDSTINVLQRHIHLRPLLLPFYQTLLCIYAIIYLKKYRKQSWQMTKKIEMKNAVEHEWSSSIDIFIIVRRDRLMWVSHRWKKYLGNSKSQYKRLNSRIFYLNRYLKNKEKPFEKQVVALQCLDLNNTQMQACQRQTRSIENMFPKDQ